MKRGGCVYIITNQYNKVLYTGVTAELRARIWEHKTKFYPESFTAKFNCNKIVWYEVLSQIEEAIEREKQIKGGSRKDKEALIQKLNPTWRDLWEDIQDL
ncbi:MAG: putative endonuclease containing a domain [Chitinophagaceae bacterium]|nr:putative endonuclease containing a domain [Chitinophagaceae bacterium]